MSRGLSLLCMTARFEGGGYSVGVLCSPLLPCKPILFADPSEVFVKLLTKFNLVLVLVFGLGMFLISHFAYDFLMQDAQRQVLEQAKLMATSAQATLVYTDEEVSPALEKT